MRTIYTCLLLLLICFAQCKEEDNACDVVVVSVDGYSDSIAGSPLLQHAMYSVVKVKSDSALSNIKDLCLLNDSLCYFIDSSNALISMDIEKGEILKIWRKSGRAKDETIAPNYITADADTIYVCDGGKNCIMAFDSSLHYLYSVPVFIFPEDFIKVEQGFLVYSSGTDASATFIDMSGKETYSMSFGGTRALNGPRYQFSSIFTKDDEGNVYLMTEYSDTIYKWTGKRLSSVYYLDYGSHGKWKFGASDEDADVGRYTNMYFILRGHLIFSFINDKKLEHGVYDIKGGNVSLGYPAIKNGISFYPQLQAGTSLIRIVDDSSLGDYLDTNGETGDNIQMLICKYKFKSYSK